MEIYITYESKHKNFHENLFENIFCKMVAILCRSHQCCPEWEILGRPTDHPCWMTGWSVLPFKRSVVYMLFPLLWTCFVWARTRFGQNQMISSMNAKIGGWIFPRSETYSSSATFFFLKDIHQSKINAVTCAHLVSQMVTLQINILRYCIIIANNKTHEVKSLWSW